MTAIDLPQGEAAAHAEFDAAVRAHAAMVYRAAMRQVRDAHLAADVTQAVFLILYRKMGRLGKETVLAAWLLRATRYACLTALQQQRRRAHHERKAAAMRQEHESAETEDWAQKLDAALDGLGRKDREALVITYFEGASHKELARQTGITEAAAHKRVQRALERLRAKLTRKGAAPPPGAAFGAVLVGAGDGLVPVEVLQGVMQCAGGHVPASVSVLAKGMMMKMLLVKMMVAMFVVGATLVTTLSIAKAQVQAAPPAPAPPSAPAPAAPQAAAEPFSPVVTLTLEATRARNDFAIDLEEGKILPPAVRGPSVMALLDWLGETGADVWIRPTTPQMSGGQPVPIDVRMMGVEVVLIPTAVEKLEKETPESFMLQIFMSSLMSEEGSLVRPETGAYQFRTRGGAMGLMHITQGDAPGKVDVRIRLMNKEIQSRTAAALAVEHVLPDLQVLINSPALDAQETITRAERINRRLKVLMTLLEAAAVGPKVAEVQLLASRYEDAARLGKYADAKTLAVDLKSQIELMVDAIYKAAQ